MWRQEKYVRESNLADFSVFPLLFKGLKRYNNMNYVFIIEEDIYS